MSCPVNRFGPSCPPKSSNADLAKEMERRLAELQAARTNQESKLGINSRAKSPTKQSSGNAPVFTETVVSAKLLPEEWEKQVATLMMGREDAATVIPKNEIDTNGIFGQKSRETEPVMDLTKHMESLAAARGSQDTDFANMVPMEIDSKSTPAPAPNQGKSQLSGTQL